MSDAHQPLPPSSAVLEEVAQQQEVSRSWYLTLRHCVEWPIALLMLFVAAPVILVVAIAAKVTSPGSAFYTQVRLGRNGRPFSICKIRTMLRDAEKMTGAVWAASANDPRLTPIGQFLRDTHLDELPQLWNVIQGHMSLVGPRPERPEMVVKLERAMPNYQDRMLVRPGLTGLAQVRLPPDTNVNDVRHKLAYDLYYVKHVGLWMDLRVLFSTAFHILAGMIETAGGLLVSRYGDEIEQKLIDDGFITAKHGQVPTTPTAPIAPSVADVAATISPANDVAADAPVEQQATVTVHVVRPPAAVVVPGNATVAWRANGNGNGNGNANGNGHAHANGNGNGNGHSNGNGHANGNGHSNGNGHANGNGHSNGNGHANGNGHEVRIEGTIS